MRKERATLFHKRSGAPPMLTIRSRRLLNAFSHCAIGCRERLLEPCDEIRGWDEPQRPIGGRNARVSFARNRAITPPSNSGAGCIDWQEI
jgi:hypothetical protein